MKNRQQNEVNSLPIKYAFNTEQFEEELNALGVTKDELHKLVKLPGGGFCLKEIGKRFADMLVRQSKEMDDAIKADTDGTGFIFDMFNYELSNHETMNTVLLE